MLKLVFHVNSHPQIWSNIENSTGEAIDTGIIVILGDFNLNMLNVHTQRKVTDLQYVNNIRAAS